MYVVTVPNTARAFLRGQVEAIQSAGYDVVIVSSPTPLLWKVSEQHHVRVFGVSMSREINPLQDIRSLWQLIKLFRNEKPDIINAGTPKAGLLGMVAACVTRVPCRIYQLRGLRLETTSGLKRFILGFSERIASKCSHYIICNSQSLVETYKELGLAPVSKLQVLGHGSSNGVDLQRFSPSRDLLSQAEHIRRTLDIPKDAHVIGFVGRLTRDKGIINLLSVFKQLKKTIPNLYLLLVGDFESGDPVPDSIVNLITEEHHIRLTGFIDNVAPYYHLMDVLVFPSYREGFPNAPLEAAAACIPTIGFQVTGVIDAVKNGETGILVPLGDDAALAQATLQVIISPELRKQLGSKAQIWVKNNFMQKDVWHRWIEFYTWCSEKHVSTSR